MFKISIIPDTNILISNLELIRGLYESGPPFPYTVNFARTVLEELDSMKTRKAEARNAIRFVEQVSGLIKTEIEGKIDDRKVEVVVEGRDTIDPKNNDDRILNYCCKLENPIFLTNDKAFYLKCQSFNIKAVLVDGESRNEVVPKILKEFSIEEARSFQDLSENYIEKIKQLIKITIVPTIIEILRRELGENYEMILNKTFTLESYLELVLKNFFLFTNFLPARSKEIIREFLQKLRNKDVERVKELASPICMIFRKPFPINEL